jgi:hypothetical protein
MTVGFTTGSSTGSENFSAPANGEDYWKFWLPETYQFVATASSATLNFSVTDQVEDLGLDAVSVTPGVPELSTWAMLALGFAGLGLMSRRVRAKARLPA